MGGSNPYGPRWPGQGLQGGCRHRWAHRHACDGTDWLCPSRAVWSGGAGVTSQSLWEKSQVCEVMGFWGLSYPTLHSFGALFISLQRGSDGRPGKEEWCGGGLGSSTLRSNRHPATPENLIMVMHGAKQPLENRRIALTSSTPAFEVGFGFGDSTLQAPVGG